MKLLILACMLGACLATSPVAEPEPDCTKAARPDLSLAEIGVLIHQLKFEAGELATAIGRMTIIGKKAISTLNVIVKKSGRSDKCLNLEVFHRPAHIHIPKERDLVAPGVELNSEDQTRKLHLIEFNFGVLAARLGKFKEVGRVNIGKLNRFVEAVRRGICGQDHHSPCPPDYLAFGDFCYKENIAKLENFTAAQALCHAENAHLPTITNKTENDFILTMLQTSAPGHSAHISLNRRADKATQFTFAPNNTAPDYTNWNPCKPILDAHKCVYLCMGSRKWVSSLCDAKRRVVCQKLKIPRPASS